MVLTSAFHTSVVHATNWHRKALAKRHSINKRPENDLLNNRFRWSPSRTTCCQTDSVQLQYEFVIKIKEWKNSTCWLVLVVIVKWWFSVLLKFRSHIITLPRATNNGVPSNLQKSSKKHCINGYNTSKYDSYNFNFPIITHLINCCWGQPMVTKDKEWSTLQCFKTISYPQ